MDMCIGMGIDMGIDMRIDVRIDMSIGMGIDMGVELCIELHRYGYRDGYRHGCRGVHRNVYGGGYRHVYSQVQRYMHRQVYLCVVSSAMQPLKIWVFMLRMVCASSSTTRCHAMPKREPSPSTFRFCPTQCQWSPQILQPVHQCNLNRNSQRQ